MLGADIASLVSTRRALVECPGHHRRRPERGWRNDGEDKMSPIWPRGAPAAHPPPRGRGKSPSDIVTIGKALSGGTLPLAAVVARESVFECFLSEKADAALQHGPTYMGNALACAAAHGSLDLFEKGDYAARVRALERVLRERLEPLRGRANVLDARVMGAIGVVEMRPGAAPASADFAAGGAFLRPLRLPHADVST